MCDEEQEDRGVLLSETEYLTTVGHADDWWRIQYKNL